jgi:class 3 adenylate cyclase
MLTPQARFCPACGTPAGPADARPHEVVGTPVAERRVTSVLFGDLVGFTPLSESRDAEDVRELLSHYFAQCRTIVARYGGTIEKFIGDAVMAVWGVPVAHEDDAERAVRAGLELVQAIAGMGEDVGAPGLAMRVGVVTGEVAVTVGATAEGMVAGDAVNTAARVQSTAHPGEVWVDDTTRSLTMAAISYRDEGSHELKGKSEPMRLWGARSVIAEVGGGQRVDGLEAPLTGRDRDLRLLKELFHATEDTGQPRLLVLDGEPGVGKSRLAWEFEKYIDGLTASVWWHRGRCLSYGDGAAFWALSEAVRGRLGLLESDTGGVVAERLEQWLTDCVPDTSERDWLRPRVSSLLGETSAATFTREDLFSAWTAFFERVGCGDPVVLVIDDAQNADDSLLDFVDHLLGTARFSMFVLAIARPELLDRRPGLGGRRASVIRLAPLDDSSMAALVDGLVKGLSPETRAMLVARAEGIPLFAVETVRALIDRDAVLPRDGRYVVAAGVDASLDSLGAPASLQALVAARLDALTPVERRVLTDASVLGHSFTRDGLTALDPDIGDLDEVLASLQRREILRVVQDQRSAERGQFTFVQGVVRQVAYATQSKRDRKARHLSAAAYLEGLVDENEDLSIVVAQHLLDAVDASSPGDDDVDALTARACAQLERAAQRAAQLAAPAEAVRLYRAALERADGPTVQGRLNLAAARAAMLGGDYAGAMEHAAVAAAAFDLIDSPIDAAVAVGVQARNMTLLSRSREAIDLAQPRWDALAHQPGAEWALLELAWPLANAHFDRGELEESAHFAERRLLLAEATGDLESVAMALMMLAVHYGNSGAPITSRGLTELAAQIARENDLSVPLANALNNLASMLVSRDLPAAIRVAQEGLEVARRASTAGHIDYTTLNYLLALWHAGRLSELRADLSDAKESVTLPLIAAGLVCVETRVAEACGEPLPPVADMEGRESENDVSTRLDMEIAHAMAQGDAAGATALAEESLPHLMAAMGIDDDFVTMWPPLVEAALAAGDTAAAERLLAPVETAPASIVSPGLRAHWLRLRGRLGALRGDEPEGVESDLRAAIAELEAFGAVGYRARAEEELGRWLVGQGREAEAAALLDSARATYEQIGANGWLARLEGSRPVPSVSR